MGNLGAGLCEGYSALFDLVSVFVDAGGAGGVTQMAKLDMDAWRRHVHQGRIPFRSDCRICAEAMGRDSPHRRTGGSATHFVLSVDICGPFEAGKDGMSCRYALVGTVAVPILGDLP